MPGRTFDDWVADVRQFASTQSLTSASVVGFSQGAPFALALAAAGWSKSVAIVAGQDDLTNPGMLPLVSKDVLGFLEAIHRDPDGVERELLRMDPDAMMRMILDSASSFDRAVYTASMFRVALRRAVERGLLGGAAGYARDTVLALDVWRFDVATIAVPVDLWYGEHDFRPVHSPDLGASLEQRIPTARRHIVSNGGGSLPWTHGREILVALLDAT